MNSPKQKIIVLCGPTAVGKTELALQIAAQYGCEIISVDSMQVYRYMDIGTAKPTQAERERIPHYLIDIADPDENFTLGRFISDAQTAVKTIRNHGHTPLLAGGTGLYFRGLFEGVFDEDALLAEKGRVGKSEESASLRRELHQRLAKEGNEALHRELAAIDPDSATRIHPNDTQRLLRGLEIYYATSISWSHHLAKQDRKPSRYDALKIGLTLPRRTLYGRIDQRVKLMAEQGLLDEVKRLLHMGYEKDLKSMQSIGYRHMLNFIDSTWTWEQALELLARDTRRYAKRQYTWFNSDPEIIWHDVREQDRILRDIEAFLNADTHSLHNGNK